MVPANKFSGSTAVKMLAVVTFMAVAAAATVGFVTFSKDYNMRAEAEAAVNQEEEVQSVLDTGRIYNNISINDTDVGGLTEQEARLKLEEILMNQKSGKTVTVTYEDKSYEYIFEDFYVNLGYREKVEEAYQYARTGEPAERLEKVNHLEEEPLKLYTSSAFEPESVEAEIAKLAAEINIDPIDATIERYQGSFTVTEEKPGLSLNVAETSGLVMDVLNGGESGTVEAVVELAYPKLTLADTEQMQSLIGTYYTTVSGSLTNARNTNVANASGRINDIKIEPGEIFSTNAHFGETTAANGYKPAGTIVNGKLVDEYGGGVCQVSSTLYNAVLFSELEVVERQNHSLKVGYLDYAFDATLAGNYIDFKFKNSTPYPIFLESYIADGGKVTVNIYGYEEHPKERRLEFKNTHISTEQPGEPIVTLDPTLPEGERVDVSAAKIGQRYQLHKYVYENDQLIEKVQVNTSTYRAVRAEVRVGTGPARPPEAVDAAAAGEEPLPEAATEQPDAERPATEQPDTQQQATPAEVQETEQFVVPPEFQEPEFQEPEPTTELPLMPF